jgi:hypothetical protein
LVGYENRTISIFFTFFVGPVAPSASAETNRKIEDTAKACYCYRSVFADRVKVKPDDGIVILSGTVQDKQDQDLAADTGENLPGATAVKNEIKIESDYPEYSDAWLVFRIRSRLLACRFMASDAPPDFFRRDRAGFTRRLARRRARWFCGYLPW